MSELSCAQIVGSRTVAPQGETKEEEDTAKTIVAVACGFRQNDAFSLTPITMPLSISILTRVELDTTSEEHDRIVEAIADLLSRWHKYGDEMSQALTTEKFFAGELRMDGGTARIFDPTKATWSETISFSIRGSEKLIDRERITYANYTLSSGLPNWNELIQGTLTNTSIPNSSELVGLVIGSDITEIGYGALAECSKLADVTIANGVVEIGEGAFRDCIVLSSVAIPDSVTTIGPAAFNDCVALERVNIPNSVTTIGSSAFYTTGLESVTIPGSVKNISDYAFKTDTNLSSLTIEDGVESIGEGAFEWCSMKTLALPSSMKSIGNVAFRNCRALESATIPSGVTAIGTNAFLNCFSLQEVLFAGRYIEEVQAMENYPWGLSDVSVISAELTPHEPELSNCYAVYADGHTSEWHVVGDTFNSFNVDKDGLVSLRIQTGFINKIGIDALAGASQLSSIEIPNTVRTIDRNAFEDCTSLSSIVLPDSLYAIRKQCFQGCTGLKTIIMPESIDYIGEDAFYLCTSVDDISCYANPNMLDWEDGEYDDFKSDGSTRCHVKANWLSDYQRLFTGVVNVTFVGDLS